MNTDVRISQVNDKFVSLNKLSIFTKLNEIFKEGFEFAMDPMVGYGEVIGLG